mgnify:FL=1
MELLTQQEAASMLNVSVDTIKRLRRNGQIPTIKIGKRGVRIQKDAVTIFIMRSKCQRGNHQDYTDIQTADTTSTMQKMDAAKEYHFGQTIYKKQRLVSKAG